MNATKAVKYMSGKDAELAMNVVTGILTKIRGVKIVWHNGSAIDADPFRKVIRIPRVANASMLSQESLMLLRGMVYHEGGHILLTKLPKAQWPKGALMEVWNAVEDRWMERGVRDRFPGAKTVLPQMSRHYNAKIAKQITLEGVDAPLWEALCAMGFMGDGIIPAWRLTPKAQLYFDAGYDTFIKWKACKSSKGTFKVAQELYDLLKDVHESTKPQQPQGQPQPQQEQGEQGEPQQGQQGQQGESGEPQEGNEQGEPQQGGTRDFDDYENEQPEQAKGQSGQQDDESDEQGQTEGEGDESNEDEGDEAQGTGSGEADEDGEDEAEGSESGEEGDEDAEGDSEGDEGDDDAEDASGAQSGSEGDDSDSEGDSGEDGDADSESNDADDADKNNGEGEGVPGGEYDPVNDGSDGGGDHDAEDAGELEWEEIAQQELEAKALNESMNEDLAEVLASAINDDTLYTARRDKDEHQVPNGNKAAYLSERKSVSGKVMSLCRALDQSLRVLSKSRIHSGLRRGTLDNRRLVHAATGISKNVFYKTTKGITMDTVVSIVIDESGSMSNMHECRRMVIAMGEALTKIGVDFEVVGTTTKYWAGDSHLRNMDGFSRTNPIIYRHYKMFGEQWSQVAQRTTAMRASQHNVDGEAVEYAAYRIATRKETRKVIFSICDGEPFAGHYNEYEMQQNLRDVCKRVRQQGIEVYGFGIGTTGPKAFYGADNFIGLENGEEMGPEFVKRFASIVTGGAVKIGRTMSTSA
jgi:hypothetical protein